MAKNNFLLNLLAGALEGVGESQLIELLQDLHDSNLEDYEAAIQGGQALVAHLMPLVTKSKSKIDDAILNAISDAIDTSAADNGVSFTADETT